MPSSSSQAAGPSGRSRQGSSSSAAGSSAAGGGGAAAAGASSSSGGGGPQPDFVSEKVQAARVVPPEQRSFSMQCIIDSHDSIVQATQLLAAAPLSQLSGSTKLQALLLLLKDHRATALLAGEPMAQGVNLQVMCHGDAPPKAVDNLKALVYPVRLRFLRTPPALAG